MWLAATIEVSDGEVWRIGPDEADASDVLYDLSFDTQLPGGYGDASFSIRKPAWVNRSALLFSPVTIYGPGGKVRYTGRVKDVSQVDLDAIRLDCEGPVAQLSDNEAFSQLYVSRDLNAWGELSRTGQLAALGIFSHVHPAPEIIRDSSSPCVRLPISAGEASPVSYTLFDAGSGQTISSIYYDYAGEGTTSSYVALIGVGLDDALSVNSASADLSTGTDSSGSGTYTPTAAYRYGFAGFYVVGAAPAGEHWWDWRYLAVFGDSGVTISGTAPDHGPTNSAVIEHAFSSAGLAIEDVEESGIVMAHAHYANTTPRDVIEQASALGTVDGSLPDWGVYEDGAFWRSPASGGKTWRVRRDEVVVPNEEGPTAENRFASVVVEYTDAAGTTKTVGPVGSGADDEDSRLTDTDDSNPALRVPGRIARRSVGLTFTEGAILLGQALLAEQNANTRRGAATVIGEATDSEGATHPACAIRAGDVIVIEDEGGAEPQAQPVNSTDYDHDSLTLTANLGATPQKVDVILARLAAAVEGL